MWTSFLDTEDLSEVWHEQPLSKIFGFLFPELNIPLSLSSRYSQSLLKELGMAITKQGQNGNKGNQGMLFRENQSGSPITLCVWVRVGVFNSESSYSYEKIG